MDSLPKSWTDDLRIALALGSEDALVEFVFSQLLGFADADEVRQQLQSEFHLSSEDALLALDRVPAGVIRAITGNPANRPPYEKDPIAHIAFEKVWSELPRKHLFSTRKRSAGRWVAWFEELRRRVNTGQQGAAREPGAAASERHTRGGRRSPSSERQRRRRRRP